MKTDIEKLVTQLIKKPKPIDGKYGTFFDYKIEDLKKEDLLELIRWLMFEESRYRKEYFNALKKMF